MTIALGLALLSGTFFSNGQFVEGLGAGIAAVGALIQNWRFLDVLNKDTS